MLPNTHHLLSESLFRRHRKGSCLSIVTQTGGALSLMFGHRSLDSELSSMLRPFCFVLSSVSDTIIPMCCFGYHPFFLSPFFHTLRSARLDHLTFIPHSRMRLCASASRSPNFSLGLLANWLLPDELLLQLASITVVAVITRL